MEAKFSQAGIDLYAFDNERTNERTLWTGQALRRPPKWLISAAIRDGDNEDNVAAGKWTFPLDGGWSLAKVEWINYTLKTDAGSPKRTSFNVHIITVLSALF